MLEQCTLSRRMGTLQFNPVSIFSVSGLAKDRFCYRGSDWLLKDWLLEDGTICGLGRIARRASTVFNGEYSRRDRTGHQCRPLGQGRSMFGLIVNTTAGSFQAWDEARAQRLGLSAAELMVLNRDRGLPTKIEEKVWQGVWQLIVWRTY